MIVSTKPHSLFITDLPSTPPSNLFKLPSFSPFLPHFHFSTTSSTSGIFAPISLLHFCATFFLSPSLQASSSSIPVQLPQANQDRLRRLSLRSSTGYSSHHHRDLSKLLLGKHLCDFLFFFSSFSPADRFCSSRELCDSSFYFSQCLRHRLRLLFFDLVEISFSNQSLAVFNLPLLRTPR